MNEQGSKIGDAGQPCLQFLRERESERILPWEKRALYSGAECKYGTYRLAEKDDSRVEKASPKTPVNTPCDK